MVRIFLGAILSLFLIGCANNGLELSPHAAKIKTFKQSEVVKVQKVLINEHKIAVLTGAGIGALSGAVVNNHNRTKGAVLGAIVGGLAGAIVGKEVEAYKTTLKNNKWAFLKTKLPIHSKVEYVEENGKITHVNVVKIAKPKVVYKTKVVEKKVYVKQKPKKENDKVKSFWEN